MLPTPYREAIDPDAERFQHSPDGGRRDMSVSRRSTLVQPVAPLANSRIIDGRNRSQYGSADDAAIAAPAAACLAAARAMNPEAAGESASCPRLRGLLQFGQ